VRFVIYARIINAGCPVNTARPYIKSPGQHNGYDKTEHD
jgi:hypothetical protein